MPSMKEMNRPPLSEDPRDRMGVYKTLAEVPDEYRLRFHADVYADRDVWGEFVAVQSEFYDSESFQEKSRRTIRRWKAHCDERDVHHALATPEDVDSFFDALLDELTITTAYFPYWSRLEAFYDWLQWHTEHPHRYHPVLMAAAGGKAAGRLWEYKLSRNRNR